MGSVVLGLAAGMQPICVHTAPSKGTRWGSPRNGGHLEEPTTWALPGASGMLNSSLPIRDHPKMKTSTEVPPLWNGAGSSKVQCKG